jgi:mitogen-activated protein kinase kinase
MLVCYAFENTISDHADQISLEKEPPRRATPWRMLDHPWMLDMKNKKVNMANFVKQVWDWSD